MAQSQTKKRSAPKRAKPASKSGSSPKPASSSAKPKSKAKTAKPKAAKKAPHRKATKPQATAPSSSNGSSPNGSVVGKVASKAKVPLVAGGAALAGAAGGMALAASKKGRKSGVVSALARKPRIKIKSGDLKKAAQEVGTLGAQVGVLANELQQAREQGNGKKHRSPIEVVLQGLTARR